MDGYSRIGRMVRSGLLAATLLSAPQNSFAQIASTESDLKTDWYGYFKLDVAYDSELSSHGNFAMYVKPRTLGVSTPTLSLTARQTRVGLNVQKGQSKGKLEFDFYGGGTENKNILMLRKAYVDIPLGPVQLKAGQDADLMSPLVPSTINYSVAWGAGNIGYRRPQVRLSGAGNGMAWGLAVARNIGNDLNGDNVVDGEASCVPVMQGRLAYTFGGKAPSVTLGGSGHIGFMDSPGAANNRYNTWSANAELKVAFTPRMTFLGEAYTGANAASYFGAILNNDCVQDLRSAGGWGNLTFAAHDKMTISLGGSIDKLLNEESTYVANTPNARVRNALMFGNAVYAVYPNVSIGLELSSWTTTYWNIGPTLDPSPTNIRLQTAIQSNF